MVNRILEDNSGYTVFSFSHFDYWSLTGFTSFTFISLGSLRYDNFVTV